MDINLVYQYFLWKYLSDFVIFILLCLQSCLYQTGFFIFVFLIKYHSIF